MDTAQLQPYMPYIVMAVNGIIAGWIAGLILGGAGGILRHWIVGIIGAFVGGWLVQAGLLSIPAAVKPFTAMVPYGYGDQILVSTIGALLVMVIARIVAR